MTEMENFDGMFNNSNVVNDSQPVQQQAHQETQPVTAETFGVVEAQKNEIASPQSFEIRVDRNQLQAMGITPIALGDKISNIPIEKYKAKQGKIDKIAIISDDVLPIKYHFIEGKGSFLCTGGKCCELCGDPTIRYIVPVCVYDTNSRGDFASSNLELKVLSMGGELYQNVTMIANTVKNMGGITHVDINVNCTDEKYQKLTLIPAGSATWRQSPQAVKFLADKWSESVGEAYRAIARSVDEPTFLKLYEEATFGAKEEPKYNNNASPFESFGDNQSANFNAFFSKN